MDEKDREILDILKNDGRASYTEIADQVDVSEATVRNRVQKMREGDVIERFTVETSNAGARSVVMVELSTGKDIEKILSEFPENIEILEITGEYDLVLNLKRESNKEINAVLDKIRSLDGVESTETFMVLEERS